MKNRVNRRTFLEPKILTGKGISGLVAMLGEIHCGESLLTLRIGHAIWRISYHGIDACISYELFHERRIQRTSAEQAVVAKLPDLSGFN